MTTVRRPDSDLPPFLFIFRYLPIIGNVEMRQLEDIADLNLKIAGSRIRRSQFRHPRARHLSLDFSGSDRRLVAAEGRNWFAQSTQRAPRGRASVAQRRLRTAMT
jgi:hypothetical protein